MREWYYQKSNVKQDGEENAYGYKQYAIKI